MADCATALQPRGRVHYFINDSGSTMEMLWSTPARAREESSSRSGNATVEGNPWK